MRNLLFLVLFMLFLAGTLQAQKIEIGINTGANFTFIPDFNNKIFLANDGMIIPGIIHPTNSITALLVSNSVSETKARSGLFFDLELDVKLNEKLKLSFSAGVLQMKYGYNTIVDFEGMPAFDLASLSQNYGNTDLVYLNLKPLSISSDLLNDKVNLQFGFLLNILLSSKYNNTVILYSDQDNGNQAFENIEKVYFESIGEMNKILYGIGLQASYTIIRNLDITISGHYYFNSIYDNNADAYQDLKDCNPIVLKTGISWTFYNFEGKKNK
jgi:hypothetical protein